MSPVSNDHHDRAAINRANSQHSTGPRTEAGKQRTRLNALRHGLAGHTIVLPTEDHAAYQRHSQSFLDEYQPKRATETQLVANLSIYRQRLARQFERTLAQLRQIQAERRATEQNQLRNSAKILKMHIHENVP